MPVGMPIAAPWSIREGNSDKLSRMKEKHGYAAFMHLGASWEH